MASSLRLRFLAGVLFITCLFCLTSCQSTLPVYRGRVTEISPAPFWRTPTKKYRVTTEVIEWFQGEQSKRELTFYTQDPMMAGMEKDQTYIFHLIRDGMEYTIDLFQFRQQYTSR
jgi:hypothetical protein